MSKDLNTVILSHGDTGRRPSRRFLAYCVCSPILEDANMGAVPGQSVLPGFDIGELSV